MMAFISWKAVLRVIMASATRWGAVERGDRGYWKETGWVGFIPGVCLVWRTSWLCNFKLAVDMIEVVSRGLHITQMYLYSWKGIWWDLMLVSHSSRSQGGFVFIHVLWEHMTCIFNVKDVNARNIDECMRAEAVVKDIGCFAEVDCRRFFAEIMDSEVWKADVQTFLEEIRMIGMYQVAQVKIMVGLRIPIALLWIKSSGDTHSLILVTCSSPHTHLFAGITWFTTPLIWYMCGEEWW